MEKQVIYIFGFSKEHDSFLKGETVSAVKIGQTTYRENEDPYDSALNRIKQESRTGLPWKVKIFKTYVFPVKTTSKVDDRLRSYLNGNVIPGLSKSSEEIVGENEIAAGREWVYNVNCEQVELAAKALCSEYVEFDFDCGETVTTEVAETVPSTVKCNIWKELVDTYNWNICAEDNKKNWRNTFSVKTDTCRVQLVARIKEVNDTLTVSAHFPNTPEGVALAEKLNCSYRVNPQSIIVDYNESRTKGAKWIYEKTLELSRTISELSKS